MTKHRGEIPLDERPTMAQIEAKQNNPGEPHGSEDHTGFRCPQCAAESGYIDADSGQWQHGAALIESSSGDHWQSKQIQWQEHCDRVFRAFDDAVAEHFPEHQPVNCKTCPEKPILPDKPHRPIDRADRQLSMEFKKGSDQDYA